MSFILDALQRAESLRGTHAANLPSESTLGDIARPANSRRPLGIGLLLASAGIVAIVILGILFRTDKNGAKTPTAMAGGSPAPIFDVINPDTPLAEVASSRQREIRSLNREVARATPAPQAKPGTVTISSEQLSSENPTGKIKPGSVVVSQTPLSATPSRAIGNAVGESLPSYQELVLNRRVQMQEFHLDIHVYSPVPDRRFVFVNNRKYREGDQLDEGGSVERITPDGAVLNHKGYRFELVPD